MNGQEAGQEVQTQETPSQGFDPNTPFAGMKVTDAPPVTKAPPTRASKTPQFNPNEPFAGMQVTDEGLPPEVAARHARSQKPGTDYGLTQAQADAPHEFTARDFFGRFHGDILTGGLKGAAKTAGGLMHYGRKALEAAGLPVPSVMQQADEMRDLVDLTPHGAAEHIGNIAESIAEFAMGENAVKGLAELAKIPQVAKLLAGSSKWARASARVLGGAATAGTVSGGQAALRGEDVGRATKIGVAFGAGAAVLGEAGTAIRGSKKTLAEKGSELADSLAGGSLQEQQVVARNVAENLNTAEELMHADYEGGLRGISANAKDIPVRINGSALQKTATELLEDSKIPANLRSAVKGVIPDAEKLNPLLEELATSPRTYAWEEIEGLRQGLGKSIRKLAQDSPIRSDLIKLRSSVDETMPAAAETSGSSEVAQQMKALRSGYAQKIQAFDESAIRYLRDKNPNEIASILLGKQSIHNVNTLRSLIGSQNMKQVEGSIFQNLFQRSTVGGELNSLVLKKNFYRMTPEVQAAVWGDRLTAVKDFVDSAARAQKLGILGKVGGAAAIGFYPAYKLAQGEPGKALEALGAEAFGLGGLFFALRGGHAFHVGSEALSNPKVLNALSGVLKTLGRGGKVAVPIANHLATILAESGQTGTDIPASIQAIRSAFTEPSPSLDGSGSVTHHVLDAAGTVIGTQTAEQQRSGTMTPRK